MWSKYEKNVKYNYRSNNAFSYKSYIIVFYKIYLLRILLFRCRLSLVLYMMVAIFLAIAIVICNVQIMGVLSFQKRNVQSIYRLSLAVADFIMGVFVIPMYVGREYKHFERSSSFTELRNVTGYVIANDKSLPMQPVVVEVKNLAGNNVPNIYVSALGFFMVLSLLVSISSLVAASIDRFVAIFRPLKYNDLKAIFAAKIVVATVWFASLVFAVFPIVIPDVGYDFVVSNVATEDGRSMLMVYTATAFFLFVLMWSSVIATYVVARPGLRNHDRQRQTDDERHLLGTLFIMIIVFTLCILPNALTQIVRVILPTISMENPTDFDIVANLQFSSILLATTLVIFSNSLWNCFIYSIRETVFRKAAKRLYKGIAQHLKLDQAWNLVLRKRKTRKTINL